MTLLPSSISRSLPYSPMASYSEFLPWDPEMVDVLDIDPMLLPPSCYADLDSIPTVSLMPHLFSEGQIPNTRTIDATLSRSASPMSHNSFLSPESCPIHDLGHRSPLPQTSVPAATAAPSQSTTTTTPRRGTKRARSHSFTEESTGSDNLSFQDSDSERIQEKRRRNKMASRRLRQRQLEHVSDLESRLGRVTRERDDLRLQLAKWEAEVMVLRKLVGQKMD
ncbi:hypothetical protein ASPACDRAFT_121136 [Aspergillus aculeatus ATCC 16872]|uniref:BZIP domain-containing protein n=1 Tax=Aspergillus aculeatus (strain ATCC 16872 / CBS 172.66 / WB 5094) TaxID=690307 RepID=A0A1L9WQY6_ASPA1|nr:uncharacterized protein ASPACDRAFT_121136 [Aspergillus aculeatus ATCC 16872]OJJ98591.1 hypothetical protein ASPACDRAFT_121136 [Aspergillus aculeatus ATCC 16872]